MWDNKPQSNDDGVYNTPQYRLDAINRDSSSTDSSSTEASPTASIQEEYMLAPANEPQLPASPNSEIEVQQSRPKKQVIQDEDEDEGVYSLATKPVPKTNYEKSIKRERDEEKNSESSTKKKHKGCTKKYIIICLIVVILALGGFGGLIAYVVIKQKGIIY
jgi:FtsZ-interacting cell division protein ZipA